MPEVISTVERVTKVGPTTGIWLSTSCCSEPRLSSTPVIIRLAAAYAVRAGRSPHGLPFARISAGASSAAVSDPGFGSHIGACICFNPNAIVASIAARLWATTVW